MVVLGILILLVVAVATATVVANGGDGATLDMVGLDIETSIAGIYAIGALNLLLAVLGVVLILGGAKRSRRRRKEVKSLRKQADGAGRTPVADSPPRDRGVDPDRGADERATSDRDREVGRGPDARRREHRSGHDDHFDSTPRD